MTLTNNIQLADCDPEDINDIISALEHSFAIRFEKVSLADVRTFGELCDKFESHICAANREDCSSQQAFYKLRSAISESQGIAKEQINLYSQLAGLFPRQNRRKRVRILEKQLGIKLNILTCPGWLSLLLGIGFIASLITLFINWKTSLSGLLFVYLVIWIADKTGKELDLQTVRELTEKTAVLHYMDMRRIPGTVNRSEIVATIKELFSKDLGFDKSELTRETKFSWASTNLKISS